MEFTKSLIIVEEKHFRILGRIVNKVNFNPINSFILNALSLYSLKTSENLAVY